MASKRQGPPTSGANSYVLSVFSVAPGTSTVLRMLSEEVDGLGTHYTGHGPAYCDPGACPATLHRTKYQWRGYVAAELWSDKLKRWAPTVLEVTESCELDLRYIYRRGQQWELSREVVTDKHKPPVVATLISEDDPTTYPPPFPIIPTLSRVYHCP